MIIESLRTVGLALFGLYTVTNLSDITVRDRMDLSDSQIRRIYHSNFASIGQIYPIDHETAASYRLKERIQVIFESTLLAFTCAGTSVAEREI